MCITFYLMVLTLEVLPIIGHTSWMKERFPWLAHRLESVHRAAPVLAVIGLGLSLLHQSSLGATYGVLKARPDRLQAEHGSAVHRLGRCCRAGADGTGLEVLPASPRVPRLTMRCWTRYRASSAGC
jgi:hypothetical protein